MISRKRLGFLVGALSVALPCAASTITFDENGNAIGTTPGFIAADPGPGGQSLALTYDLPFTGLQGDVILVDTLTISDVLRFNGNSTVVVYSISPPVNSIADQAQLPGGVYGNDLFIEEANGPTGSGIIYAPTAGQPGFDASAPTYDFISDPAAIAPEPGSLFLIMAGVGFIGFGAARRRRLNKH